MSSENCPETPLVPYGLETPDERPKPADSPDPIPDDKQRSSPTPENLQTTGNKSPDRPNLIKSPDPNCSICLGKLQNKSFTDSCFHQFCFTCLVEWSKVNIINHNFCPGISKKFSPKSKTFPKLLSKIVIFLGIS